MSKSSLLLTGYHNYMRILFDEQIFLLQKRGGISRYFTELIKTFMQHPELSVEPILNIKNTSNEALLNLSEELGLGITKSSAPKSLQIAQSITTRAFSFPKADLLHHTFYSKIFWHAAFKGPRTSTHYDMIPETFHETHLGINPHLSKRWYFKNVDHIFSISNSAKQDLLSIWPDIDTPISITHLGKPEVTNHDSMRIQGYIIFVGSRRGYKNAETLIRAFAKLPEHLRFKLEFLGGDGFTQAEKDLITSLGISKNVWQRNVTDLELSKAYCKAHLFVFPSRYEGFGLPTLEALQLGCRSILSNAPALREVAGTCADYFAAVDVDELTNTLFNALVEGVEQNPHLESGINLAKNFSWLQTAKETAKFYHSLI